MPSICTPTAPSDLHEGFMSSILVSAGLPEGAEMKSEMFPNKHTVVVYRAGVSHVVSIRKDATGACFDFTPPIPID